MSNKKEIQYQNIIGVIKKHVHPDHRLKSCCYLDSDEDHICVRDVHVVIYNQEDFTEVNASRLAANNICKELKEKKYSVSDVIENEGNFIFFCSTALFEDNNEDENKKTPGISMPSANVDEDGNVTWA